MNTRNALTITMILAVASMGLASTGSAEALSDRGPGKAVEVNTEYQECLLGAFIKGDITIGSPEYKDALNHMSECRNTYVEWIDSWYDRSILDLDSYY